MNKAMIAGGLATAGAGLYYAVSDTPKWGDAVMKIDSLLGGHYQES